MQILLDMLTYRRPHGSKHEQKFINRFIKPLGVQQDAFGNLYKAVGDAPSIMWCAHTDTVHKQSGRQQVLTEPRTMPDGRQATVAALNPPLGDSCLGADDGAGVWLLTQMIKAKVPGLYVFFRQEEHGCVGSSEFLRDDPGGYIAGLDAVIALDRWGTDSVITHQCGQRTCSDRFARSLADALGMSHAPDPAGAYTDSEVFADVVPECTNLSVGYDRHHTQHEYLDLDYIQRLRDALVTIDITGIVIERDPRITTVSESSLDHLVHQFPITAADLLRTCGITITDFRLELEDRGLLHQDELDEPRFCHVG